MVKMRKNRACIEEAIKNFKRLRRQVFHEFRVLVDVGRNNNVFYLSLDERTDVLVLNPSVLTKTIFQRNWLKIFEL